MFIFFFSRSRDLWDNDSYYESPAKRRPWSPSQDAANEDNDAFSSRRRRRSSSLPSFKRRNMGSQFDEGRENKFDPYFYQQRVGGGPRRAERQLTDRPNTRYGPSSSTGSGVREYRGPRWHKAPKKEPLDDSIATEEENRLGLENKEPLTLPEDVDKKVMFDDFELFGPSKGADTAADPDVFSPENKSGKKRRSQRYIPY